MSIIGGLFKSIAPIALGMITGGASLAIQAALKQIIGAVIQQVIQKVGEQLGLPQPIINMAKQAAGAAMGLQGNPQSVGQAVREATRGLGMSPMEAGSVERQANSMVESLVKDMMRTMSDEAKKNEKKAQADAGEGAEGTAGAGGNFLRAIAIALGAAVDDKMNEMAKLASDIKDQTAKNSAFANGLGSDAKGGDLAKAQANSQKLGTLTSMFQAVSQEMNILQNVIKTALDSVGQAQATVARKG